MQGAFPPGTLYVSGEESPAQIKLRAERLGPGALDVPVLAETNLETVLATLEAERPEVCVIDSVQTLHASELTGAPGSVGQVREVASRIMQVAKARAIAVLLVGHVTKEGSLAGPRVLEHLVDVVLQFEGDRHSRLRLVRSVKNRYGATDEVGCFELSDAGIVGLADPSGLFRSSRDHAVPGACVTVALEGRRPLVAEVQALVTPSTLAAPRRATSGLDASRIAMVVAVLDKRMRTPVASCDIFAATVGGIRLTEPAVDLAVVLAIASSFSDRPLPSDLVVVGEVGLAGEVRRVSGIAHRLAEAARLGFTAALVPRGGLDGVVVPSQLRAVEVSDVTGALEAVHRLFPQRSHPAVAATSA